MLLSLLSLLIWAQFLSWFGRLAFLLLFYRENEGVYWDEESAKMRVSVTGQETWGFSPFSPMFLSLPILLKRHKRRNFKGKSLLSRSLPTRRVSSSHRPSLPGAPAKKHREGKAGKGGNVTSFKEKLFSSSAVLKRFEKPLSAQYEQLYTLL